MYHAMDVTIESKSEDHSVEDSNDKQSDFKEYDTHQDSPERNVAGTINIKMVSNEKIRKSQVNTPMPNVSQILDDVSESDEYKHLMTKLKKSHQKARKPKRNSKNTRNDSKFLMEKSRTSEVKKSKKRKYVVRRKPKRNDINKKSEISIKQNLGPDFTFKPKLDKKSLEMSKKYRPVQHTRTPVSHKLSREIEDLRECTFTPNLNKTKRLNHSLEAGRSPRHEILYQKHSQKLMNIQAKSVERQTHELDECTFIPKVNNSKLTIEQYKYSAFVVIF